MPDTTTHAQRTQRFDLRALFETSQLLSSSLDLEFVLNNLLLTAMSKLLVTRGAALLYEPLEDAYRAAAVKGLTGIQRGDLVPVSNIPSAVMLSFTMPIELEPGISSPGAQEHLPLSARRPPALKVIDDRLADDR